MEMKRHPKDEVAFLIPHVFDEQIQEWNLQHANMIQDAFDAFVDEGLIKYMEALKIEDKKRVKLTMHPTDISNCDLFFLLDGEPFLVFSLSQKQNGEFASRTEFTAHCFFVSKQYENPFKEGFKL